MRVRSKMRTKDQVRVENAAGETKLDKVFDNELHLFYVACKRPKIEHNLSS